MTEPAVRLIVLTGEAGPACEGEDCLVEDAAVPAEPGVAEGTA